MVLLESVIEVFRVYFPKMSDLFPLSVILAFPVTRLYHVIWKSMDIIVRFRIMARLKNVTFVKRLGILLGTAPSGESVLRCGQAGHFYRDWRNEPVAATTPGPPEMPDDPEDNRTGESDS